MTLEEIIIELNLTEQEAYLFGAKVRELLINGVQDDKIPSKTENELVLNDLQVYGSISNKYGKIGETTSSNSSSSVSIPSGAWSDTNSRIMLTRGVHIVMGTIIFGACKGGRLGARFASSSGFPQTTNVIPGNITSATAYIQCQWIVTVAEDTEYRLQAWQSTGEDVNITSTYMKAVRIS